MPGADGLLMRIYAATAQKEREPISARTKAAQALMARGVQTPRGSATWTHTTVARVLRQAGAVAVA